MKGLFSELWAELRVPIRDPEATGEKQLGEAIASPRPEAGWEGRVLAGLCESLC